MLRRKNAEQRKNEQYHKDSGQVEAKTKRQLRKSDKKSHLP